MITLEMKKSVLDIVRLRCCLYSEESPAWMRRDGVNSKRIGPRGIEWLIDVGVLDGSLHEDISDGFYEIDRQKCISLFFDLMPDQRWKDPRFASDHSFSMLRYQDVVGHLELQIEQMRLWMFFREISNAARSSLGERPWTAKS